MPFHRRVSTHMNFHVHTWNTRQSNGKIACQASGSVSAAVFSRLLKHMTGMGVLDSTSVGRRYLEYRGISVYPLMVNHPPHIMDSNTRIKLTLESSWQKARDNPAVIKKKEKWNSEWKNRNQEKSVPDSCGDGHHCRDTSRRIFFIIYRMKIPVKKQNTLLLPAAENHD